MLSVYNAVGTFGQTTLTGRLNRIITSHKRTRYDRLLVSVLEGRDNLSVLVNGNNYLYTEQSARLESGLILRRGAHLTDWGGLLTYRATRRADGTAQHRFTTARAGVGLHARRHWNAYQLANPWSWLAEGRAGAELDAGSTLNVPNQQENRFTRAVVYPDYLYARQHTTYLGLSLGIQRRVSSLAQARLLLNAAQTQPFGNRTDEARPTNRITGNRGTVSVTLQLIH